VPDVFTTLPGGANVSSSVLKGGFPPSCCSVKFFPPRYMKSVIQMTGWQKDSPRCSPTRLLTMLCFIAAPPDRRRASLVRGEAPRECWRPRANEQREVEPHRILPALRDLPPHAWGSR